MHLPFIAFHLKSIRLSNFIITMGFDYTYQQFWIWISIVIWNLLWKDFDIWFRISILKSMSKKLYCNKIIIHGIGRNIHIFKFSTYSIFSVFDFCVCLIIISFVVGFVAGSLYILIPDVSFNSYTCNTFQPWFIICRPHIYSR